MNSIDDFRALRPEADPVSPDELDEIWASVVGLPRTEEPSLERVVREAPVVRRRRRVAMLGAAAIVAVGVGALVIMDRPAAAPTIADQTVPSTDLRPSTDLGPPLEDDDPPLVELGESPKWIAPAGWTQTELFSSPSDREVALFAGPAGIDHSWVAIIGGMSEPLGGTPEPFEWPDVADGTLFAERRVNDAGNYVISAGGVSTEDADAVFDTWMGGGALPAGFTAIEGPDVAASMQFVRYRFVSDAGDVMQLEVQGGGADRFDQERSIDDGGERFAASAVIDDADVVNLSEYTLLLRTGFWVTQVTTSAPPDDLDEFARLVEQLRLDGEPIGVVAPLDDATLALGDSVLLGAAEELYVRGIVVDAVATRTFSNGLDTVRALAEVDRLPRAIVVHLGNNGLITTGQLDEMMELLSDVPRVVVVTVDVDEPYAAGNNALLRSLPANYDNVEVLDWAILVDECPGDCLFDDGVHLAPDGRAYYAALFADL